MANNTPAKSQGSLSQINWPQIALITAIAIALVLIIKKLFGEGGLLRHVFDSGVSGVEYITDKMEQAGGWTWDILEEGAENVGDWMKQLDVPDPSDWF